MTRPGPWPKSSGDVRTHAGRAGPRGLGIESHLRPEPPGEGRIERLWGTLQDRLVAELRLAGITTVAAANAFLPGFTTRFNARFGRPAADSVPAWRPVPRGLDLERICSLYTEATVAQRQHGANAGTVLQIPPGPGGRGYAKARVEVRHLLDGSWRILPRGSAPRYPPRSRRAPTSEPPPAH